MKLIKVHYFDETGRRIEFKLKDWDAVVQCADSLARAPIDLEFVYFEDGPHRGIFNLHTFEVC